MVTKQQAIEASEFHAGQCVRTIGPRGGVKVRSVVYRRNGQTQTWKTRPDDFRVPVKHGLYEYAAVEHRPERFVSNADLFHTAEDCTEASGNLIVRREPYDTIRDTVTKRILA